MSTSYHIYVGPFIIATYEPQIIIKKSSKLYCTNNCFEKGSHVNVDPPNKFCPKCGAECMPIDIERISRPDWFDLIGDNPLISWGNDINDAVRHVFDMPVHSHVLLPNAGELDFNRNTNFDPKCETGSLDISKINIEDEKAALLEYCADEIEILRENYKEIIVKHGMIYWTS